jgi:hypothetical protein
LANGIKAVYDNKRLTMKKYLINENKKILFGSTDSDVRHDNDGVDDVMYQ